jgi:tripartite-type tricarboxylate transporter receptor subunit TctC
MKFRRRQFLQLAGVAAVIPSAVRDAWALDYPTRPVRFIVGYAAGGGTDAIARVMAQSLSERLGQPFAVENHPGAGTNIATETVVNAIPDGYTLLLSSAAGPINMAFNDSLKFDFSRDLVPVGSIVRVPLVLQVHPSLPVRSVSDFIAYVKANPSKARMASPGVGTAPHMAGELFKQTAGISLVNIPYRGEALALADVVAGRVQLSFLTTIVAGELAKAGKLRSLGVTTLTRLAMLPDTPPIADVLPGYEADGWYGVSAPRGTSDEIVNRLNTELNAALADPKMKTRLVEMGLTVLGGSPQDYRNLIADEADKWRKVVRLSHVKPD